MRGQSDRTIEPGQVEKVEVEIATGGRPGSASREVPVQTNDRAMPTFRLEAAMMIMTALKADPPSASFIKVARSAGPQTQVVKLKRGDGGPLNPKITKCNPAAVSATVREVEPGEQYEVTVTVSPPWPNGSLNGSVMIDTGVPEAGQESIPVAATITPRLAAQPASFRVPAKLDADADLQAKLVWSDGQSANVLGATVNDSKCEVRVDEADGQQVIVLHVPAGYQPARPMGLMVQVQTDDPEAPTLQIPISSVRPVAMPVRTLNPTTRPVPGLVPQRPAVPPPPTPPSNQ